MSLIAFAPAIALSVVATVLSQEARRRRTPAGIVREDAARRTVAWWTRRFSYQRADFTPEGLRYWRWARVAQAGALAAGVGALLFAVWSGG